MESMVGARGWRMGEGPRMGEFGAEQRGREVWMIFAAPAALPARGDAAAVSRAILDLVNTARAEGRRCGGKYFSPAPPPALHPALTRAALAPSRDMAGHDPLHHRRPDGRTPSRPLARARFRR